MNSQMYPLEINIMKNYNCFQSVTFRHSETSWWMIFAVMPRVWAGNTGPGSQCADRLRSGLHHFKSCKIECIRTNRCVPNAGIADESSDATMLLQISSSQCEWVVFFGIEEKSSCDTHLKSKVPLFHASLLAGSGVEDDGENHSLSICKAADMHTPKWANGPIQYMAASVKL